jgi:hypothetical protein
LLRDARVVIALFLSLKTFSQSTQTVDFTATKDAYIRGKSGGDQAKSFGDCNDLRVKGKADDLKRSLIQFDISSIPSNAYIESAELRLNSLDDKDMTVSVFEIGSTNSWDESSSCGGTSSANWNTRSGASSWTAPGVVGNNYNDGTPIATITANYKGIQSWFITSLVQDWVSGFKTNNGVMLGCNDGNEDESKYESLDEGDPDPPTLRITYRTVYDNDNDGVYNQIDIDDDNDGILDTDECSSISNPPLLNSNFEAIEILTLDDGPTDVVATDGIWKGDASHIPNWLSADPVNNYLEIWHNSHQAGNDAGGQAYSGSHWAEINATTNDGLYQDIVTTPGTVLQWTFAHRKRTGYAGSANEDIAELLIGDPGGVMTSQGTFTSAGDSSWTMHTGQYVVPAGQTTTRLTFTVIQTASGSTSSGNFIDQVQLYAIPNGCEDFDGDSVPDYLDLDTDNDGIPDIVENGNAIISAGTGTIPAASFVDTNNNGMHDAFESNTPLDSDGDGAPNFRDLDSDNDANFDVDEARTKRYVFGNLVFDNGDGDINGDGVGDGAETEAFREKDDDGDGTVEYFGDGILDKYDYGTGANEYGNLSQGSAPHYTNNEDNGSNPDYLDLDSNDDGVFDIEETHYAHLDSNNDGKIDDTNDADGDGLVDSFDTNDTAIGSPRDLQGKFELSFDGRNDYLESDFDFSGLTATTVMTWIKLDPDFSNNGAIFNQGDFLINVNGSRKISAKVHPGTVKAENVNSLELDRWYHIAVIFDSTQSNLKLYINGNLVSEKIHPSLDDAMDSSTEKFTIAKKASSNADYFNGMIDEIRIFDVALTEAQLLQMMHQEIDQSGSVTKGSIIPVDIIDLSWSNLKRYYRMDAFKDNVVDDLTTPTIDDGSGARMYNTKLIADQTAPLPYVTKQSGRLDVAVEDPVRGINGSDALNNKGAIFRIAHNDVYVESDLKQSGLIIDAQDASSNPIEFSVKNDSELNVSWYLELDGKLDLEGESQLVQGDGSILDADSSGYIEKDQQGTANSYNYNYWCSSVSPIGATGARGTAATNDAYIIGSFLHDGSQADNGTYPRAIDFQWSYTAADAGNSDPITISTYWLWKYHGSSDDYNAWQKIYPNTPLLPGEGYTMKGSSGPVPISSEQNYVFKGKPNNGDFTLPLTPGNDRLIGNPYPSAMDAEAFIKDNLGTTDGGNNTNGNVFNGALYFWDHFGSENSHYLSDYVGGYATRNLIGGAPAIANDARINATGGAGTKIPGRYIPVNQGFFVLTSLDEDLTGLTTVYGGDIVFKNSQRVFKPETPVNSVFMRHSGSGKNEVGKDPAVNARVADEAENDAETRPLIRLNFDSPNGMQRQIVAGVDKNATNSFDLGYDALLPDLGSEDMFWTINDTQFVIQGVDNFDPDQELPIGLIVSDSGVAKISLNKLENIDANVKLYIKDKLTEETFDITEDPFEIELQPGEYYDRFSLVFQPRLRTLDELALEEGILIFMNDSNTLLKINRLVDTEIESVRLFNSLGQSLNAWDSNLENRNLALEVNSMSTGMYIVQLETIDGDIIRKMLVD